MWPAKIERFDNDRVASKETRAYFDLCIANNKKMLDAFSKKYRLHGDVYTSVLSYKTPWKYAGVKCMIYIKVMTNRLQNMIFRKWMFQIIPRPVKNAVKKIIGKNINDLAQS